MISVYQTAKARCNCGHEAAVYIVFPHLAGSANYGGARVDHMDHYTTNMFNAEVTVVWPPDWTLSGSVMCPECGAAGNMAVAEPFNYPPLPVDLRVSLSPETISDLEAYHSGSDPKPQPTEERKTAWNRLMSPGAYYCEHIAELRTHMEENGLVLKPNEGSLIVCTKCGDSFDPEATQFP